MAAEGRLKCASCGKPLKPQWRRCPHCHSPVDRAAGQATLTGEERIPSEEEGGEQEEGGIVEAAPQTAEAAPASTEEVGEILARRRIDDVEKAIIRAKDGGKSTFGGERVLGLARYFLGGKKFGRAVKYAKRAERFL